MIDYTCKTCDNEFKDDTQMMYPMCPKCKSFNTKRLWCTNFSMNGNGYKNNFIGRNKK